jgi:hypothetical protein
VAMSISSLALVGVLRPSLLTRSRQVVTARNVPMTSESVLVDFLRANADVFAWSPSDMPAIPRDVTEHSLDIRAGARPVKQPLRRFDEEKRRTIGKEIHKLMAAGFIKRYSIPNGLPTLCL